MTQPLAGNSGTIQQPLPNISEGQLFAQQQPNFGDTIQRQRRVSFGSVFDGSSGVDGGGNDDDNTGGMMEVGTRQQQQMGATFNLEIKPKDPPMFYSRATEDVSTWISKVSDFFYLTRATEHQQVAYAATLLQEAAAD